MADQVSYDTSNFKILEKTGSVWVTTNLHSASNFSELGDPNDFSPDALVEDVKSLVDYHPFLCDKRFVLVGHSMGGRLAMCYAAKYPEHVSSLVIEDMDIRRSIAMRVSTSRSEDSRRPSQY